MKKVLCPGEALIDFVAVEGLGDLKKSEKFIKKAGGAPANAAGAIAKFGVDVHFVGSVGNDPFGYFLKETLDSYNIDTSNMQLLEDCATTIAFVSLAKDGERDFKFNRGADGKLMINTTILKQYDCFHFASATAFLGDQLKVSYDTILNYAIKNKKLITFDANYRKDLFGDKQELFIKECKNYICNSYIAKLSEDEAKLISGVDNLLEAGKLLQKLSGNYILLTLGKNGTYIFYGGGMEHITTKEVAMVDATGAGDAFIGAVVALATKKEGNVNLAEMIEIVKIANMVGAMTTTNYGGLESIPNLEDIIIR